MTEEELTKLLKERDIPFELYRHEPIFSAKDPRPASIPRPQYIVKNLLVETADHSRRYLLTLRLDDRADLRGLARFLGCGHLSFVAPDRMEPLIGVGPGSATPLALIDHPHAATLVLDSRLPGTPVCCHPLHNAASVELACDDLAALLQGFGVPIVVADISR